MPIELDTQNDREFRKRMAQIDAALAGDLREQIEAERREYIQQRLNGYVGPPALRTSAAEGIGSTCDKDEPHSVNHRTGANEVIPSVEELRRQVFCEREAFIGAQLGIGCAR